MLAKDFAFRDSFCGDGEVELVEHKIWRVECERVETTRKFVSSGSEAEKLL